MPSLSSRMGRPGRESKRANAPKRDSSFAPINGIVSQAGHVRKVPIVLQKFFWGDEQNFSGPLMPFARGDMRDHIVSHKNDHGPSYRRYEHLQQWSRLKICFREIFGIVRFSTFATKAP